MAEDAFKAALKREKAEGLTLETTAYRVTHDATGAGVEVRREPDGRFVVAGKPALDRDAAVTALMDELGTATDDVLQRRGHGGATCNRGRVENALKAIEQDPFGKMSIPGDVLMMGQGVVDAAIDAAKRST